VYVDLRVAEYSGLEQTNAFDAYAAGVGLSSTADSGPLSITASNELLFAAGMTATTFTSTGNGFTTRSITSPDGDLIGDRVATAPGQYNVTATLSSGAWLIQLAAFKAASSVADAPTLQIFLTATNTVFLAWPAIFAGFTLQQNPDLIPTNWSAVTNDVTVVGSENTTVLSLPLTTRFYRLRHF